MRSFLFGGSTGETAESLRRKREIAQAMLMNQPQPTDLASGLRYAGGKIAAALAARSNDRKIEAGEQAWRDRWQDFIGGRGRIDPASYAPSDTMTPFAPPGETLGAVPPAAAVETRPLGASGLDKVSRALLDTIAGPESGGRYNVRFDGSPTGAEFSDFTDHPRQSARIPEGFKAAGSTSSAAGRYQFIAPTWDRAASALGLTDFSPASQDQGALWLAVQDYRERTGRDLMADLADGASPEEIAALGGTWEGVERDPAAAAETFNALMAQGADGPAARPMAFAGDDAGALGVATGMGAPRTAGLDPELMALASDGFMPENMRGIVQALMANQLRDTTPETTEFERLVTGLDPATAERARRIRLGLDPGADAALRVGAQRQDDPIAALRARAQEAGLQPGTPEYNQFMLRGGAGDSRRAIDIDPTTGAISIREGAGAGAVAKPFTEGQSKDIVYATRAEGALETVERTADALASFGDRALDMDPTGAVRGAFQSEEYQVARAAADEFLQAILRKDTGAAITSDEQALYGKTYLPQPGDGPEVLAYKREARRRAVEAVKAGMSPAQMIAQERALSRTREAGAEPERPADVPPEEWDAMTPEERALWAS